jgi:hypothetical protein
MDRRAVLIVFVLGVLVLFGAVVGVDDGVRDDDMDAALPRLLVMLFVTVA